MSRVWLDGRLVAGEAPLLRPDDRGLLLGDGLFETIRIAGGRPRALGRHLARLEAGAALLALALPAPATLAEALAAAADANAVAEGAARITVTRGPAPRGLDLPADARPTVLVAAWPGPPMTGPIRLVIDRRYRRDEGSPLSRVKALGYLPSILARRDARAAGAEDAILTNMAGRPVSGSAATLLLWAGEGWRTPPPEEGALPGTACAALVESGLARLAPLSLSALRETPAALLVNALGCRPVAAIDGRPLRWPAPAAASLAALAAALELPALRPPQDFLSTSRSVAPSGQ